MKKYPLFWNWLGVVKGANSNPSSDYLFGELKKMPKKSSADIGCAYMDLMAGLDKEVIWQAGSLINGSPLGDDGFEYFRSWIIWNGERFYEAVIGDVNNLLSFGINLSNPAFEALGVCVEFVVYPEGMKSSPFENSRSDAWNWQRALASMKEDLPDLWRIYGNKFNSHLTSSTSDTSLDVPGLGILRIGDRVTHKFGYGAGTIVEILSAETGLARIKFDLETKPFRITAEYFSRNQ